MMNTTICKQCGKIITTSNDSVCASCSNKIVLGIELPRFIEKYPNKMRTEYLQKEINKKNKELELIKNRG